MWPKLALYFVAKGDLVVGVTGMCHHAWFYAVGNEVGGVATPPVLSL